MPHKMEIMIVYHQAFDLYHTAFRMLQLLIYFNRAEAVEMDRLRMWDYYLLFPLEMQRISFSREEKEIKEIIKQYITQGKKNNSYEIILDNRKMFEKIKPYQMAALKCLASFGIINLDYFTSEKIKTISSNFLHIHQSHFEPLSITEENTIKLLTSHYYQMPLKTLKEKTNLIEYRYDTQ